MAPRPGGKQREDAVSPSAHPLWLSPPTAFLGLIVLVVAIVLLAYAMARQRIEDGIEHTLSSVAQIKTEQIEHWLEQRRVDMQVIVASPVFTHGIHDWLEGKRSPGLADQLAAHIRQVSAAARTSHFCLRSSIDGAPLLGSDCDDDSLQLRQLAMAAARSNKPQLEDFHLDDDEPSTVSVGMLCPIVLAPNRPPLIAHFSMDPRNSLFPTLQQWPGGSPSAEVLLVRRDGEDVQFLNTLRYRKDPPLAFRHPLADGALLASQAIDGKIGLVRGHDYRGVASVGYVMPVAGTPWFLVAKMDRSEAETWLTRLTLLVAIALASVVVAGLWWWMQRQRYVERMHGSDVARAVLRERMDYLTGQTHDCIVLIDLAGRILESNEQCADIYGWNVKEMLARDGRELLAAAQPDGDLGALWARLSADGDLLLDTEQTRKNGAEVVVEISMRAIKIVDSECIQAIVRDITERKRAEARIEDLYQNAPCGYHSIDADGRFCMINNTELAWLGYRREEIIGLPITDLLTDASRENFARTFPVTRRFGFARDLELEFIRRDGSVLPTLINVTAIYAPDGRFVMTRSVVLNVSERRALEKERERQAADLAELSHRLMSVQEDERRRLSAELHDRTSPNLAALDMNLRSLARRLPASLDGEAAMLLDDATALLADTADSIREVCADLRPPILDYAGLLPALQSYALQYSGRTGIAVELDSPSPSAMRFAPEVESTLFRIAQEALTNCAKHADADQVHIRFEVRDRQVAMEVVDDGNGFVPYTLAGGGTPGLGLLSMRERARFAGGEVQVDSQPGRGTRLLVTIPTVTEPVRTPERRRQSVFHPARSPALLNIR